MENSFFSSFLRTLCAAITIVIGVAYANTASAETLVGTLRNNGGEKPLEFVLSNTTDILVIEARTSLLADLRRLKTGDLITAQGSVLSETKKVHLESIDSLGIQQLLGTWKSDRYEIFEFKDFNQLNLYIPTYKAEGGISFSQTHSLSYVVTPAEGDGFSIFITDDSEVKLAFLELQKNKLNLTVTQFKNNSGLVTENISLSPINLQ